MFTPGRWKAWDVGEGDFAVGVSGDAGEAENVVAVVRTASDAALIATAPDLYDMLRELRGRFAVALQDGAEVPPGQACSTLYAVDVLLRRAEGITR